MLKLKKMKKIITALALIAVSSLSAQIKEGSVTYAMIIEGLPADQAAMMGDMETKIFFKNNKSYSEMNSMMYSIKTLSDDNGSLMLMDQMGNKFFVKHTKADLEKETAKAKEPKIEYTNDTKTIAGYECKKAILIINDEKQGEVKSEVWYTEKIANVSGYRSGAATAYKGIKGMMMEFSVNQGPMKIKMVAKEVSTNPVSDDTFIVSTEGYKEMKPEDLKRQSGTK